MSGSANLKAESLPSDGFQNDKPVVSIGMPVYNGERYLHKTLQSIVNQDFKQFELIIVDNASEDETEAISTSFANSDDRIRYHRNSENIGAAQNYCRAFDLSTGPYFKWASYDDWLEPEYLDACIAALESRPDAVLAYPHTNIFDETGRFLRPFRFPPGLSSDQPATRFHHSMWSFKAPAVFGVIRTDALRQTRLIQEYKSSDRPLLSELVLAGAVIEVDAYLFNCTDARSVREGRSAANWWKPASEATSGVSVTFDRWRLLGDYVRIATRTPGVKLVDRAKMSGSIVSFFARQWPRRALWKESRRWALQRWRILTRLRAPGS